MCGSSPPPDNSVALAKIDADREATRRAEEAAANAQKRKDFEGRLSGAYSTGLEGAREYFTAQGLDPEQYMAAIQTAANSAKTRVPDLDASPGTFFENMGATVFNNLQEGERAKDLRGIDSFAGEGFAESRIGNDVDDPFLEAIIQENQVKAEKHARRMLDRGIVTETGYDAAIKDILNQRVGASSRLSSIGLAELEKGRSGLRDIASKARTTASTQRLGTNFDPFGIEQNLNKSQTDFFAGLANSLRAAAPEDLFDTDGLLGIAGGAQGAQNTAFNAGGLEGLDDENADDDTTDDDEDEEDDETNTSPFASF